METVDRPNGGLELGGTVMILVGNRKVVWEAHGAQSPCADPISRKREAPVVPGTTGGQPLMGISLIENINCLNGEFMSLRKL